MSVPATRQQDVLIFEVTQRCDLECLHCYNAWKNRAPYPAGELDTAQTLALMDRALDQSGASMVTLTGGEPLLRSDLEQLVEHLLRRQVAVDLITNGQLLDQARIQRLTPDKIGVFELPLLASEAPGHDRLAARDGAFNAVTTAVADLKLADQRVIAVFVATRLNLPDLVQTAELALALGVDALMFNRFNPGGEGARNLAALQPDPQQLTRALDQLAEFSARYDFPVSCSIPMPPCLFDHLRWPGLDFGFCAAGTDQAYYTVDPLGNLRPCNHSALILGNLLRQDFWQLVDGPRMAAFCAARPAFCEECELVLRCLGGCKAAAEVCGGDLWACDPFLGAFKDQARRLPPR